MNQTIIFQRLEGSAIFIASLLIYLDKNFSILVFVFLLLTFDIFMIGYYINNKIGAYAYNVGHSLIAPLTLGAFGYSTDSNLLLATGLIWTAHIGMDRAFGYGLKHESGFKDTHLGKIGKK